MDITVETILGILGGALVSGIMIVAFHRVGGKLGDRIVRSSVVSDRHLQPMFGRPVSDWQSTFAWKPVNTIDEGYIWMKRYWRRRIHKLPFLHGGDDFWWQNVVMLRYIGE